ncbi:MAG: TetR/AcrR family transcriptional regulator [Thermoanaerobaculia bacterium]
MQPPLDQRTILAAARSLCLDGGMSSLSMRRLAEQLGVTAGALYRHFRDKDAIVQQLVDEANRSLGQYLKAGDTGASARSRLLALCDAYLQFAFEQPGYYDVLLHSTGRRDLDLLPGPTKSENFALLLARVSDAQGERELRSGTAVELAISLWGLMHGLVGLYRQGRFGGDLVAFRRVYMQSLKDLLTGLREPIP